MVAHSLHNKICTAVADCETLASQAVYINPSARGAVSYNVAGDGIFAAVYLGVGRKPYYDIPARQSLADVVVCLSLQVECDSRRKERPETLSGNSLEVDFNRVLRQPGVAVLFCHSGTQHCSDAAVEIVYGHFYFDGFAGFNSTPYLR